MGKHAFTVSLLAEMTKDEIQEAVMKHEKTAHYLGGASPKKNYNCSPKN